MNEKSRSTPENTGGKQAKSRGAKGRFGPGQSGNPAGKPKGARNRATRAAERLLEGEAEAITRKAVELALEGDGPALRLCLERVLPVRKGRPISIALPAVHTAEGITGALGAITEAMARGDISPEEAGAIAGVLEQNRKAIETEELARRIEVLESRQPQGSPK